MSKQAKRSKDSFIILFSIFIVILLIFFVIITLKIAISPICTSSAQQVCVIDTGSVVGLTTAIFGIAATLLTFLGAFAVAYWWTNLDKKVDKHIEDRTNELIEQKIKDQDEKFQTQIAESVTKLDIQVAESVKKLNEQITQIEGSFQFIRKELVIVAMIFPPWDVERWAEELLLIDPSSEIAGRMVMSYLDEVDFILPDPSKPPKWQTLRFAPNTDPLYYWNKALAWRKKVKAQNNSAYLSNADWQIEQRRQRIEAYQKKNAGS